MNPNYERNIRIYLGNARGVPQVDMAKLEHLTQQRVYQIIAATEYQLAKGNPDYWAEYKNQTGNYGKI